MFCFANHCRGSFYFSKGKVEWENKRAGTWGALMAYPIITQVLNGSIAEELGIETGDSLVSMNGEAVCDIFDYRFHAADAELTLRIGKPDGNEWEFSIEKDEAEDLGLEFENPLIDREHGCTNNCVFCFIDQLPKGMRDTLYFKDDDARLSFLYGNYITMTNMKDEELDRIIRYRMSPINISVHATNPELRVRMLGNRFAGNILERVGKLVEAGITVNAQIVLCRGWNDGAELERTLSDLTAMAPLLHSISVVPIGLTRHREGLPDMKAFDMRSAQDVLSRVETWQRELLQRVDTRTVYAADEFYLMAECPIPDAALYEDFPQIENGVGMLASLREEFIGEMEDLLEEGNLRVEAGTDGIRTASIATGEGAAPEILHLVDLLCRKTEGKLVVQVHAVPNRFFGGHVNVTGLLTGSDLLGDLPGKELGGCLLLCRSMFRAGTEVMLDDVSRNELEEKLGLPVEIVDPDGISLVHALLGWTQAS